MSECRACHGDACHVVVHRLIDAIQDATVTETTRIVEENGERVELWTVVEALLSVTASFIDATTTNEQRASRFRQCEEFFRREYVS